MKRSVFALLLFFLTLNSAVLSGTADSLFYEYNRFSSQVAYGNYDSAYHTGEKLMTYPGVTAYSKWFYPKFAEVIINVVGDTSKGISPAQISDRFLTFRNHDPQNTLSYLVQEAFILDKYYDMPFEKIYPLYKSALELKGGVDDVILQRISEKASRADLKDSNTILNILDIYTYLLEKYPNTGKWGEMISDLAGSEAGLIKLRQKLLALKPESLSNIWALSSLYIEKENYKEAQPLLRRLTFEVPGEIKYWKAYTFCSEKLKDDENSLIGYLSLIKLDSTVKEYYFNVGVLFEKKDNYQAAVKYFKKASEVGNGWGRALFYEGLVYENSARSCGKLEFDDKCVYQLAYERYLNALGYDPSMTELQKQIEEIEKYLPEQADFASKGYKSGDKVKPGGNCYNWIEIELTVQ
ncbi:MAG: hypothetical protein IPI12_11395 [Ignavibacteriales bacterium]|nr:hypothetical protein [Ignavibacteriales bacterium]